MGFNSFLKSSRECHIDENDNSIHPMSSITIEEETDFLRDKVEDEVLDDIDRYSVLDKEIDNIENLDIVANELAAGDVTPTTESLLNINSKLQDALCRLKYNGIVVNSNKVKIGLESTFSSNVMTSLKYTREGIMDALGNTKDKIVKWFKEMWNKFRGWLSKNLGLFRTSSEKAKKILETLGKMKNKQVKEDIEVSDAYILVKTCKTGYEQSLVNLLNAIGDIGNDILKHNKNKLKDSNFQQFKTNHTYNQQGKTNIEQPQQPQDPNKQKKKQPQDPNKTQDQKPTNIEAERQKLLADPKIASLVENMTPEDRNAALDNLLKQRNIIQESFNNGVVVSLEANPQPNPQTNNQQQQQNNEFTGHVAQVSEELENEQNGIYQYFSKFQNKLNTQYSISVTYSPVSGDNTGNTYESNEVVAFVPDHNLHCQGVILTNQQNDKRAKIEKLLITIKDPSVKQNFNKPTISDLEGFIKTCCNACTRIGTFETKVSKAVDDINKISDAIEKFNTEKAQQNGNQQPQQQQTGGSKITVDAYRKLGECVKLMATTTSMSKMLVLVAAEALSFIKTEDSAND